MKIYFAVIAALLVTAVSAEDVYVESPTDTDSDGKLDRIFVSISRPITNKKVSAIYEISPYSLGGNSDAANHSVDSDILPQDRALKGKASVFKSLIQQKNSFRPNAEKYAYINAHSLGTGKSTGCPTVGDMSETLAAKAVIDWLNGKARAFSEDGKEVSADWSNGKVGMTGTSYNGTLPIMVAATGVEGLKAIVPIAAISSWYDYYRSNGLVVNPGGYVGEDADVLGYFIVRRGTCKAEMEKITRTMGRENGDFTKFWQDRDYLPLAKNFKAATFIIHGQSDWNVKQKNAIQLWEALEGIVPRRMFLHRGGHGSTYQYNVPQKIQAWFDYFLENEENGITKGPQVEVELNDRSLMTQEEWPNETTQVERFYFDANSSLTSSLQAPSELSITDTGSKISLTSLIENPTQPNQGRLVFLTPTLKSKRVLSGTAKVSLNLSVLNRKAANITVAIVAYDQTGKGQIITRGWADPQNYRDITRGEILIPGQTYNMSFVLEPKQTVIPVGSKLGVVLASTDYDYTLRPQSGTKIQFKFDKNSFIDLNLSRD